MECIQKAISLPKKEGTPETRKEEVQHEDITDSKNAWRSGTINRVLNSPDIILQILRAVAWDSGDDSESSSYPRGTRNTLLQMARTCRRLLSPALDILWNRQESLVPLLSILPTFSQRGNARDTIQYALVGIVEAAHWGRLSSYARRIKHLECKHSERIEDFALLQVAVLLKGEPLLPSLRILSFPLSPPLFFLVSTQLRQITVGQNDFSQDATLLLNKLSQTALGLSHFSIANEALLSPSLWEALPQLTSLRYLSIHCAYKISVAGWTAVSELQQLHGLALTGRFFAWKCVAPISTNMARLKQLTLTAQATDIGRMLQSFTHSPLSSVSLQYAARRSTLADALHLHIETISQWSETLVELKMETLCDFNTSGGTSLCRGLAKMSKLTKVSLPFEASKFSDEDLLQLASAWPNIEQLKFGAQGSTEDPAATFTALENFAIRCPKLRVLYNISLQIHPLPPTPRILSHRLQILRVLGPVPPDNAARFARYIDALFPSLHHIEGSGCGLEKNLWSEIADALIHCQGVRADDKKRRATMQIDG